MKDVLVEYLTKDKKDGIIYFGEYEIEEIISWLKKQGEQKFVEWSEEDELCINQAIYVCHQNGYTAVENKLKSFKERMKGE